MRRHTVIGQEILSSVPELADVGRLVRHSHERWDGRGYPDELGGSEIPLGSRIIFCADAFHAIRCDRPYRAGRSAAEAVAEIKRCAGSQFDPTVATALEEVVRDRQRRPRGAGSSRLFALLMCLVVGGAGTAIARSDLLGDPDAPASSSPAPVVPAVPPGSPVQAGSTDSRAGSSRQAQHRRRDARASRHSRTGASVRANGSQAGTGESTDNSSGWHGSGKSSSAPGHTKPSGSSGPGKSGSAPGHNKPRGSSGPGKSGSAPGRTKPASGGTDSSSSNGGGSSHGSNGSK
jgi:HD domain